MAARWLRLFFIARVFLGSGQGRAGLSRARVRPSPEKGVVKSGRVRGNWTCSCSQFPQPLADVRGPPCKAGLRRFWGLCLTRLLTTAPQIGTVAEHHARQNRAAGSPFLPCTPCANRRASAESLRMTPFAVEQVWHAGRPIPVVPRRAAPSACWSRPLSGGSPPPRPRPSDVRAAAVRSRSGASWIFIARPSRSATVTSRNSGRCRGSTVPARPDPDTAEDTAGCEHGAMALRFRVASYHTSA